MTIGWALKAFIIFQCSFIMINAQSNRNGWRKWNNQRNNENNPSGSQQGQPMSDSVKKITKAPPDFMKNLNSRFNEFAKNTVNNLLGGLQDSLSFSGMKTQADPQSQRAVNELSFNDPENYYLGDIDLTMLQAETFMNLLGSAFGRKKRKVGKPPNYDLWDKFPIPYRFADGFPPATMDIVRQAIKLWESNTCVRYQVCVIT